jgi:hypothetical protein
MSKAWIRAKRSEFGRDVVRDFCLASRALEAQFSLFDRDRVVDFEALRDLTGEEMNKGLLWRLKDTAHHFFRNDPDDPLLGRFLDWGLGYIFHETLKLKEDAYQLQSYIPWFQALDAEVLGEQERRFQQELMQVLRQTRESISREIARIRFILDQCRSMIPLYFQRHRESPLLARFFFDQAELVASVFQEDYDALVNQIYGDAPEALYVLAARSLRQGGWLEEARRAAGQALALNPASVGAREEMSLLELRLAGRRRVETP